MFRGDQLEVLFTHLVLGGRVSRLVMDEPGLTSTLLLEPGIEIVPVLPEA